jgi:hypothetical protein
VIHAGVLFFSPRSDKDVAVRPSGGGNRLSTAISFVLVAANDIAADAAKSASDQSTFQRTTALIADDAASRCAADSADGGALSGIRAIGAGNCEYCAGAETGNGDVCEFHMVGAILRSSSSPRWESLPWGETLRWVAGFLCVRFSCFLIGEGLFLDVS